MGRDGVFPSYLKMAREFKAQFNMGVWASMPYVLAWFVLLRQDILLTSSSKELFVYEIRCSAGDWYLFGAQATDNVHAAMFLTFGVRCGFGISPAWTIQQKVFITNFGATAGGVMNGITNLYSALIPAIIDLADCFDRT